MKSYSRDTKSHHISRKIPGHIASGFSIFMKLMLMISIFKKAYEYHQLTLIIPVLYFESFDNEQNDILSLTPVFT